ncbi:MAG: hypothetical protein EBU08_12900 [Micrococcales bacterium]|nr:hypothetical protein [Micrococcales bacterium]
MGTRNLTKVIDANGVVKVAQYGQWDGYPSGQGVTALYHAHNAKGIESNLSKCYFASKDELENIDSIIAASKKPIVEMYPTLSRDTCADILGYVAFATQNIPLVNESAFENEGMCEGVYTIDFQRMKFVSKYHGKVVEFDLEDLPSKEEYLGAWE